LSLTDVIDKLTKGDASGALAPSLAGILDDPKVRASLAEALASDEVRAAIVRATVPPALILGLVLLLAVAIGRRL
jgi:hypothetical protein